MKTFEDRITELCARRRFGMKPGLERMTALMERMDHPERSFVPIHIAGTNGKGSVTAMIASVLSECGFGPVGRYTSPHLVFFNERICIDGQPVSDPLLDAALEKVESACRSVEEETDAGSPTFFECATAMAFEIFRSQGVRLAVIETGLGGRLDATNVILPAVSVITCIGMEHSEYLGDTIAKIATEKAGILKKGRPAVLGREMIDEARAAIESVAREKCIQIIDPEVIVTAGKPNKSGLTSVSFESSTRSVSGIKFALSGAYQHENLTTAISTLEVFSSATGLPIPDEAFVNGLRNVVWPCRFQTVLESPRVIVDGAHNPNAAAALKESVKSLHTKAPLALVAGFCDDKDCLTALKILHPLFKRAFATTTPSPRTLPADAFASRLRAADYRDVTIHPEWQDAVTAALDWAKKENGAVIVCGSLFLAGAVCKHFGALPWTNGTTTPAELLKTKL